LQEMLTIKSDDVIGRAKAYEAIIRGEEIQKPQVPASFAVLVRELQGLSLNVEVIENEGRLQELESQRALMQAEVFASGMKVDEEAETLDLASEELKEPEMDEAELAEEPEEIKEASKETK